MIFKTQMKKAKILLTLLVITSSLGLNAQVKTKQTPIQDFMDLRFGMFIHWGPVSLRGTEIGWSRGKEVPTEEYDNLYKEFNPVLFNADAIVKAAKDAGMKYLTITARHHDGFCLWPTKFNNYNIMNSPYKKDIVGALNEACKKQGIKFCIYYSVLDWWHQDYPNHNSADRNGIDNPKADMNKYLTYMRNQLKELITKYDPAMLWFDGQWEKPWTNEMGIEMYKYLKTLKPNLVINNRLGKEFAAVSNKKIDASKMVGDYDTPEQAIGNLNMDMPWESCFTICKQWAWKPNDKMKSLTECLDILSKTAGGNGNLLLNVGPMPDGRIEARQITRLKEIGDWLKINGQAIYGTLGGPYHPSKDYATTRKGDKIYVHVLNTGLTTLTLKNLPAAKILSASTLDGKALKIENTTDSFSIQLPNLTAKTSYVIALQLNTNAEKIAIIN